jgi:S-adenosylmethionine:tRNA ribosyltransferase-isomerase
MLVVDRSKGAVADSQFADICSFLTQDDLLVFNDTKVIPARLLGVLDNSTRTPAELLLLEMVLPDTWYCLGRPLRKIRARGGLLLNDSLKAVVVPQTDNAAGEEGEFALVRFETTDAEGVPAALFKHGMMPIPPYIRKGLADAQDRSDYQSIFARHSGSVAAPTASLHFSPALMEKISREVGCRVVTITLHVGSASFLPVIVDGQLRPPSSERFEVPPSVIAEVKKTKETGRGRVIAVGTTVVRALESACAKEAAESSSTELFIRPGFTFKGVDALVTNFHQPGTTHLLLVEALVGRDLLDKAYTHALAGDYRFLSYGDGMLII